MKYKYSSSLLINLTAHEGIKPFKWVSFTEDNLGSCSWLLTDPVNHISKKITQDQSFTRNRQKKNYKINST